MQTLSQKIIHNTAYNLFGKSFTLGVNILITPYVLSRIDLEGFGIWATITILTGYLGLFDLGVGNSFVKHIAEYHTKGESDYVNHVMNTGFLFYGLISFSLVLPAYFLRYRILGFFNISSVMMDEAVFALLTGLVIFVIMNFFGVFLSLLNGIQRMDVTNVLGSIMSVIRALGIVLVLELGYGLRGLMVNQAVLALASLSVLIVLVMKFFPAFSFRPVHFHGAIFRRLLGYGYKVQIGRVAEMVNLQLDKILIGHFVSMSAVSLYDVAAKITNAIKLLPLMSLSSVIPASSQLKTEGDDERLLKLFYRGSRYLLAISIPIAVFVMVHASLIMRTWLGPGYGQATVILRILTIGYSIHAAAGVGLFMALGVGRPDIQMKCGILMATLNVLFSIVFILKWGLFGAALGSTLAAVISMVYFIQLFHRFLHQSTIRYYRLTVRPLVISVGLALLDQAMLNYWGIHPQGRVTAFTLLALQVVFFFGFYVMLLLRAQYFDLYDRRMLSDKLPLLRVFLFPKEAANH